MTEQTPFDDPTRLLASHDLPARWKTRRLFTFLDTRVDDVSRFMAAWSAWRSDPSRCERLHFVLLATPAMLGQAPAGQDAALARQLAKVLPMRVTGMHRLEFEDGRVVLTLAVGVPSQTLSRLWLRADAIHLCANALGDPRAACKSLSRIAGADATLSARAFPSLQQALESAGFVCDQAADDAIIARFTPRWRVRRHEPPTAAETKDREAIVIGAGLAGCAVSARLAARGWRVTLVERHSEAAREASGNPAGVFHPIVWRDDSVAARLTRAGFLYALHHWRELERFGHDLRRTCGGLLQIADTEDDAAALAEAIERFGFPRDYVIAATREDASRIAGVDVARGGWYFAHGGAISPSAVCAAQCAFASNALTRRFVTHVERIAHDGSRWHAFDANGDEIACADVVVLANARDAERIASLHGQPTRTVRGQLSVLDARGIDALRVPVIGDGYAVPLGARRTLIGATYDIDDTDSAIRGAGHLENVDRVQQMLPSLSSEGIEAAQGRVAFRCVTSDRMPMIGQLADEAAARRDASRLSGAWPLDLPRAPGLYGAFAFGSRGLVWAALGAELIASQIEGEPLPIERELADAIDPARFLLRALRHGELG
jgi:tRNA 5-methylaminomethyl-2-thiouridine biosynthesis bifunctional protein